VLDINSLDLSNLSDEQMLSVQEIIKEIKIRKLKYPILDFHPQHYQQEFLDAVSERKPDWTPKWKFIIFLGWNGSWKTVTCAYITMLMALGKQTAEYWLPYIWEAKLIKIFTTTWDNIRDNIDRKYLLWTWTDSDKIKLPWYINREDTWEVIKLVRWDKEILKEIKLWNGAVITTGTYDQWQERLQWWEPDFTWMDELPTRYEDLTEIWRGTRNKNWQLIISATPTNYNKKIKDYIFNEKFKDVLFVRQVDSFENVHWDHTWMIWLSEEDKQIKRFWSFIPPEWLVYKNFISSEAVLDNVPIRGFWKAKYYWAVDFWVNHPMAFLFIAVDEDWRVIVFDEVYEKGMLLWDLVKEVNKRKREHWIEFEYIIADSAWSRERKELLEMWMPTRPANKRKKENNVSNRKGWIFKINQLLSMWKLYILKSCKNIINEFENHHFAKTWEDWRVEKEQDDALDALRYFIFSYFEPSLISELIKRRARVIKKTAVKRSKW
jgi:hypothetical protein